MREFRCFGPPGTGKTTWLSRQVNRAVESRGPGSVLVCSFTKAAVSELNSRKLPIPEENIGTLHALAYRALGNPKICETSAGFKEFSESSKWQLHAGTREDVDDGYATCGEGDDERIFANIQAKRGRRIPVEAWTPSEQALWRDWQGYKADSGQLDFTDLIEDAQKYTYEAPGQPQVGFFDESQDFTPLELKLVRHWGEQMETFTLAGDDDQCAPSGVLVATDKGDILIEHLTPEVHHLVSYDRSSSEINGRKLGHNFQIERTTYSGPLVRVVVGNKSTSVTPRHRWLARWNKQGHENDSVVYLMRRGPLWRIGWCQLFRADGTMHLGVRCRIERADQAWILYITKDRPQASIMESFLSAKYGIPTALFQANGARCLSQSYLDTLWEMCNKETDMQSRAITCLNDHGRDIHYPIYNYPDVTRSGAPLFLVNAINLLPAIMQLPIDVGKKRPIWEEISNTGREMYNGTIHSLKVTPHPYYIADGIITHNSIYGFKGVSVSGFLNPPLPDDHIILLKQSYRVPSKIHEYANNFIHRISNEWRQPKEYKPREFEGNVMRSRATFKSPVSILDFALEQVELGKTVMWLTTCGYMLIPLIKLLRHQGMPFSNPYRRRRGDWNPLYSHPKKNSAVRMVASFLRADESNRDYWTGAEFKQWSQLLKGVIKRGMKENIEKLKDDAVINAASLTHYMDSEDARASLSDKHIDWLKDHTLAKWTKSIEFPLRVYQKNFSTFFMVEEEPMIRVGTIHSVKGGESDIVILFPDVSPQALTNPVLIAGKDFKAEPAQHSIIRQFYVGITRAKETLVICDPISKYNFPL